MSFEERRKKLQAELAELQEESNQYLLEDSWPMPQDLRDRIADKQWEIRDCGRWLRALGKE